VISLFTIPLDLFRKGYGLENSMKARTLGLGGEPTRRIDGIRCLAVSGGSIGERILRQPFFHRVSVKEKLGDRLMQDPRWRHSAAIAHHEPTAKPAVRT